MTSSRKLRAVLVHLLYAMQVIGALKVFHLKIMLKNSMLLPHIIRQSVARYMLLTR